MHSTRRMRTACIPRCLRSPSLVVTVVLITAQFYTLYVLRRCHTSIEQHLEAKLTHPLAQPLVHIVFLQDVLVDLFGRTHH